VRVAIIGAGPAGWAAALNLSNLQGIEVTVFHGGIEERDGSRGEPSKKAYNVKLLRGSDFPYRDFPFGPKTHENDVHIPKSFSKEGLSLVWGATMLPYAQYDIQSWPISTHALEPGYKFISEKMPIAGRVDRLAEIFMPFISQPALQPTNRILKLLEVADDLPESDVSVGSSRLAVFNSTRQEQGCIYCDLCLQGCPDQKIWSAPTVVSLNVKYMKNFRIIKIHELDNQVLLQTINEKGEAQEFNGFDKVFLAAGNVESFRILATSGYVEKNVTLQDSATFYMPLLISGDYKRVEKSKYSLSQAFVRIQSPNKSASQLQIYDYSEDLVDRARSFLPFGKFIPRWVLRIPLKRMFVSIGYLDSHHSPQISMALDIHGDVLLSKSASSLNSVRKEVKHILNSTQKDLRRLGLWALSPLIQYSKPGGGAHSGGWLPMGKGSDLLGRPKGMKNVHVIDSSILPSIPAGAITFTVMANAVRITGQAFE
jgi:choline dehydrogenase-like flavoprotein